MSRFRSLSATIAGLATALILSACGGGGDSTGPSAVTSISLTASNQFIDAIGGTVQLTVNATDSKGRAVSGQTFTWTSSNNSVATVANGVVTAVANGTATITATLNNVSGSYDVTVQQVARQAAITLPSDTIFALNEPVQATATARDSRGNAIGGFNFHWTTSNQGVISVDGNGLLTSVSEGSATIRVTSGALAGEKIVHVRQRAARLNFVTPPAGARAGLVATTQPVVEVVDSRGNRVTTDNTTAVTLMSPTGATIIAGGTRNVQGGLAAFQGVSIGGTAGQQTLRATAPNMTNADVTFTLQAGNPTTFAIEAGNNMTAPANTDVELRVIARDAFSNGVSDASVQWAVTTGAGSFASTTTTTGVSGVAANNFRLSRFAGLNVARVSMTQFPAMEVTFSASGTPNGTIAGTVSGALAASAATRSAARSMPHQSLAQYNNVRLAPMTGAAKRLGAFAPHGMGPTMLQTAARSSAQATASAPTAATQYVPGELLVVYRPERLVGAAMSTSALQNSGTVERLRQTVAEAVETAVDAGLVELSTVSPALLTAKVKVREGVSEAHAMAELRKDPRVLAVERNGLMYSHGVKGAELSRALLHTTASVATSGEHALRGILLDAGTMFYPGGGFIPSGYNYAFQSWHYNIVGLPRAWEITTGSPQIIVAVVDDGARFDHPAMQGMFTSDGFDFVAAGFVQSCAGPLIDRAGDGNGYDTDATVPVRRNISSNGCYGPIETSHGHGVHVAGTIGMMANNSFGMSGVNRSVRIRPVRVLDVGGSGTFYDIAQGVLYAAGLPADNGNNGSVLPASGARVINMSLGGGSSTQVLQQAVSLAHAAGSLIIASAGNNNNNLPNYPAAFPEAVSVSALAPNLLRAPYSTWGSTIEISAPGGNTGAGPTSGIVSTTWNFVTNQPTLDSWQGTSMAAPHVSGIAALVLASQPNLTNNQLRQRLRDYSVDMGPPGWDDVYGFGMINARNAITQSLAPASQVRVMLVDANTGAVVRTVNAPSNGTFSFTQLPDGNYWVYAGDFEADNLVGLPGRRWTALGGGGRPSTVVVSGAAVYPANFTGGTSTEVEPNNTAGTANELMIDGYVNGQIAPNDVDVYRVRITQAGVFTFTAWGQVGACGMALEVDPVLTLYDVNGTPLAMNDDVDPDNNLYCSRIDRALNPGTYFIAVSQYNTSAGRYVVSMRRN